MLLGGVVEGVGGTGLEEFKDKVGDVGVILGMRGRWLEGSTGNTYK